MFLIGVWFCRGCFFDFQKHGCCQLGVPHELGWADFCLLWSIVKQLSKMKGANTVNLPVWLCVCTESAVKDCIVDLLQSFIYKLHLQALRGLPTVLIKLF